MKKILRTSIPIWLGTILLISIGFALGTRYVRHGNAPITWVKFDCPNKHDPMPPGTAVLHLKGKQIVSPPWLTEYLWDVYIGDKNMNLDSLYMLYIKYRKFEGLEPDIRQDFNKHLFLYKQHFWNPKEIDNISELNE